MLVGGADNFYSPAFRGVEAIVADNALLFHQLNTTHHTLDENNHLLELERITQRVIDPSVSIATDSSRRSCSMNVSIYTVRLKRE